MHYHLITTYGSPDSRTLTLAEKLLANSERLENGCLMWTGDAVGDPGNKYGRMRYGGKSDKTHKWAYQVWVGEIPEGLKVLHKCDFKLCIEPTHLEVGTTKKNNDDAWLRGRHRNKLTKDQILEIRARYTAGGIKQSELAKEYGVSSRTISKLLRYHIIADGPRPDVSP